MTKTMIPFAIGKMPDGRLLMGGAFQMSDTHGFPLINFLDECEKNNVVCSMPHYFASAIEHGWDDRQTFSKIEEALTDKGNPEALDAIKMLCIGMFMRVAETMPGCDAMKIATRMREQLESQEGL